MPLQDCFVGSADIQQRCAELFYLTVHPRVKNHPEAGLNGITFQVDISGVKKEVRLNAELCFTLVFNDQETHTVIVTHKSGFRGEASGKAGARASPPSIDVELSKPWNLEVLVKERWPDKEQAFRNAKVLVAEESKTAGADGKLESKNRALADTCNLKLDVKGLRDEKCKVTVKTEFPASDDGFLGDLHVAEVPQTGSAIDLSGKHPGATLTVTYVMEVSVIEPKLEADPIALVARGYAGHDTSLSELKPSLADPTHPVDDLAELKAVLTFDDKIKCYKDDKGTTEYASGTSVAPKNLPPTLYVKGLKTGESKLTLTFSTDRAEADRSWRLNPDKLKAEGPIWVEKLEIEAWQYLDGKDGNGKVTTDPKTRELHNQNANNDFTAAQLAISAPSDEFWTRGGTITLLPTSKVSLFTDKALTTEVSELKKSDFSSPPCKVWVKSTGAVALDADAVDWTGTNWRRLPEKVVDTTQLMSCGAKVRTKDLRNGDIVKLETYSFDVHLDRKTGNECRRQLAPDRTLEQLLKKDVALAYAGGHQYYTRLSAAHINKNYDFVGTGTIFHKFINSMKPAGDVNSWSQMGTTWVRNHLSNAHGIVLHATTQAMIKEYIWRVLEAQRVRGWPDDNFGFDFTRGVPGVHAEVLAVNEILNTVVGIQPEEITVATYRLQNSMGGQGKRFVACTNCRGVLLEGTRTVRVITG